MEYYEGNIKPSTNTVFVFGSDLEGKHEAGAAKVAMNLFSATYRKGEGLQGSSYALPTKDLRVKKDNGFKSIYKRGITKSIKKLFKVARDNPKKIFKIAYRNTTETSLDGYTGLEMHKMFEQAGYKPENIVYSKEWCGIDLKVVTGTLHCTHRNTYKGRLVLLTDVVYDGKGLRDHVWLPEEVLRDFIPKNNTYQEKLTFKALKYDYFTVDGVKKSLKNILDVRVGK